MTEVNSARPNMPPIDELRMVKDSYRSARGGSSMIFEIDCAKCDDPALLYQKDGPGQLLRCYTDRILWPPEVAVSAKEASSTKELGSLACQNCGNTIGGAMIYKPEQRLAFRLIKGSYKKSRYQP